MLFLQGASFALSGISACRFVARHHCNAPERAVPRAQGAAHALFRRRERRRHRDIAPENGRCDREGAGRAGRHTDAASTARRRVDKRLGPGALRPLFAPDAFPVHNGRNGAHPAAAAAGHTAFFVHMVAPLGFAFNGPHRAGFGANATADTRFGNKRLYSS